MSIRNTYPYKYSDEKFYLVVFYVIFCEKYIDIGKFGGIILAINVKEC